MTRTLALLAALPLLFGCGSPEDEKNDKPKYEDKIVKVGGQVKLHPLEVKWRADNDLDLPSVSGLTVNIEDAMKATAGHPPLNTITSDDEGQFEAAEVDVTNVNLALVASVKDPTDVLAPCGYGLLRGRPEGDLVDMPVYVVSNDYLDYIAEPTGYTSDDLLDLGFIFVQITDKTETMGVAGAKFAIRKLSTDHVIESEDENPLWYMNETISALAPSDETTESGVLLYVPEFGAKEYTAIKDGSNFELKLAGARKNFVLSVFIVQE